MTAEQKTAAEPRPQGPAPLAPAVRQRLQKVFEHANRCVEKADYDYAHQLFSQCVSEDPASLVYLQAMLSNLQKKYNNNKKGAKFAGMKSKSQRSAMAKAAEKGLWQEAFLAGCGALALNPWDTATLRAMADGCQELGIDECQLYYLRAALDVDPKDPAVNRQAALALQRMGQFDQAISCWHRVEQAKPEDDEAREAISRLAVEKTIHKAGYDPTLLGGKPAEGAKPASVARYSRGAAAELTPEEEAEAALPRDVKLRQAIEKDPATLENYFHLADFYLHSDRLEDAGEVLEKANQATGGGDLSVRERLEEIQLRTAARQAAAAQAYYEHEKTPEAKQLLDRARAQANQVELEVYEARSRREPLNMRLQFELGMRLKKAGKIKEAITSLQAARGEPRRKALVFLELGECFQKIEQYKLAMSHYEQALDACEPNDLETRKLTLYRAGVLATGLRELDRAERHFSELAGLDFGYRDVAERLDKVARLRDKG